MPSLSSKPKSFLIQAENCWKKKMKLKFFRIALFHRETRVCRIYLFHDCVSYSANGILVRGKKNQSIYLRLALNERQILRTQGMLCICFISNLERLSDSKFLISKGMFCQIWGPLNAIVLIPDFVVDLWLNASILGFLKSWGQSFVWNISFIIGGDEPLKNF